jgi:subtilisin family serine protease
VLPKPVELRCSERTDVRTWRGDGILRLPIALFLCVMVIAMAARATADRMSPRLAAAFASDADSMRTMIAYVGEQVELTALDATLNARGTSRAEHHRIVVSELRQTAARSQGPVRELLDSLREQGDVAGFAGYWIVNAVVVRGNERAARMLAARSDIDEVDVDFAPRVIEPIRGERSRLDSDANTPPLGIRAVNAPRVWYELGITGQGALLANLDSGVDGLHPALSARWRGNFAPAAECWRAPISGSPTPHDNAQHGTHVMGTMCGATSGGAGDTVGVAPGALWIADDAVGGNEGSTFDNNVLDAFQWLADPDGDPNTVADVPDVCENSWGVNSGFAGYADCDNRWTAAVEALEAATCVAIFAAGNEGPAAMSLRSPANIALDSVSLFAVGAADLTSDTLLPVPVATFSSRGPSDCDSSVKPEVIAPGVSVYSAIPGGGYGLLSGTSMAGPHVAGIVGLMRSANPNLDVRTIKSILMRTAHDQDDAGKDNVSGWGFVDAYAAVSAALPGNWARIAGVVRDAGNLEPLQVLVEIVGGTQTVTTGGTGAYVFALPGDSTYTLRFSKYGYRTQTAIVTTAQGDVTAQDILMEARAVGEVLRENFDAGAPGWTHAANPGWVDQWSISSLLAASPPNAYMCSDPGTGVYAARCDALLISPVIANLPPDAWLHFSHQIESEYAYAYPDSAYDGGVLEIAVNSGGYQPLTPVGGYPKTFRYLRNGAVPVTGPMAGRPCWAGITSGNWNAVDVDLAAYAGQIVQFRWRFGSDAAGYFEGGWWIDDVVVDALAPDTLSSVSGLVIGVAGTDLKFAWRRSGSAAYHIYRDGMIDGAFATFVGITTDTTYTVVNGAGADSLQFYLVRSWDGITAPAMTRNREAIR